MPAAGAILAITWGLPIASVSLGNSDAAITNRSTAIQRLKTLIKQVPGGRLMYLKTTLIHSIATPDCLSHKSHRKSTVEHIPAESVVS
jgi:hypothetical protein